MKRSSYISCLAAAILAWGTLLPAQVSSEQIPFKVGTFEAEGRVFVGAVVGDAKVIDLVKANKALQQRPNWVTNRTLDRRVVWRG